ncbi:MULTISPECIES: hypothetical protein [unclassified Pseudoalteromonas]|jgi:hypothetical protein|uniref:hypothetical protein n=1 Tax=unclassified Pseudoalteromonas TaxID=194690 RepID=UPI0004631712|nr:MULTISPECIES: hypothetical protein [unclassified Pseudoalteromonas]MBH0051961.1 hypothetical protein [Pseudoalteromonas sp. SWYJZ19]MBH0088986.1 hypothetical protein [Pseudoalteromonas sp. NSLLW218]
MDEYNLNPGSSENPILIKNKHQNNSLSKEYATRGEEYVHRPLLQMHTKNNNGENAFAFDKAPEGYEFFTPNVITNPNLQLLDIKVALSLFELLDWRDNGEGIVYPCTSEDFDLESYGELGEYIHSTDGQMIDIDPTPLYEHLSVILNTTVNNNELNKALARLDSFHYINLTPINEENSKLYKKNRYLSSNPNLILVEINDMMDIKNLTNIWI